MHNLKYHPHYFSSNPSREVKEVYWYSILNSLAQSLVFIFEPIYLYSLGYPLAGIMWFYVQVYAWYAVFISFGAKFAGKFGYKHAIFVSNLFYVAYWATLFAIKNYSSLFFVAPVFYALQKSWFWPAYNADVAQSSYRAQRGREVSVLFSLIQLAFITGPFLGGFISETYGFAVLFIIAAVLVLLSAYPLFASPEMYSRHDFRFKHLLEMFRRYKGNFFGYWGYAEDLMVMSLWPVYIFIIVPDFFNVGLISTIATVVGTVLMLYVGRLSDRGDKRKIIQFSSVIYGVTWFFRFVAQRLVGVLTFDTLTKAGRDATDVTVVALTYERASGHGSDHAIAYSVFYEFSLAIGKILTALAAIAILAGGGSIYAVFALVGLLTMFYGFLK